ncbi:MAG: diguanylate cyclase [Hespellia sp.]|nr:diguanylate cyclase [Hespellia sp.]
MIIPILCIVIMVILWRWTTTDIMLEQGAKKYLKICIFLTILVVAAEIGCISYDNTIPENRTISILFNMIGFGTAPFVFLFESCFYSRKRSVLIFIPVIVNLAAVLLSPVWGWVFYVTEECVYQRGPLYFVFIVAFAYSVLISLERKVEAFRHFPSYFKRRIINSSVVMLGALLVQVIFSQYHTTWIIICVYFVLYYALLCEINSMVDGLTGVLNKFVFNKQIQHLQITHASRYYLLMIDVNDFKLVNDRNGHLYGDKCLIEIAALIRGTFDSATQIFRFGGDEFSVLLKAESDESVEQYIEELKNGFDRKQKTWKDFPDIAVGYAQFTPNMIPHETVSLADELMYENKRKIKEMRNTARESGTSLQ